MSRQYFRSIGQQAASLGRPCPRFWDRADLPMFADAESSAGWLCQGSYKPEGDEISASEPDTSGSGSGAQP
jgi:hypothetical protein